MDILATLAVTAGPLLIVGLIMWGVVQANMQDLRETWVEKRCNPLYMPFAGLVDPKVTTFDNFQYCTTSFAAQVFARATDPIHMLFQTFTKLINMVLNSIGQFRAMATGLITFVMSFVNDIFGKIGNTFGVMVSLMSRIRDLTARILGSAGYTVTIVIAAVDTISAVIEWAASIIDTIVGIVIGMSFLLSFIFPILLFFFIPMGIALSVSGFSCFHPDTRIQTISGRTIPIREVKVGDVLAGGGRVTATMAFDATETQMYNYKNIIVAGEHLVCENGVWIYVKDSPCALAVNMESNPREIICLNTSNHHIWIGNVQFSDYEEIEEEIDMTPLDPSTEILTPVGSVDLSICIPGMMTTRGRVHGVVNLEGGMMQLFMANHDGMIPLAGGRLVRDYADSHDHNVLAEIQEKVLNQLNKKSV
jgi:hypothetical protein